MASQDRRKLLFSTGLEQTLGVMQDYGVHLRPRFLVMRYGLPKLLRAERDLAQVKVGHLIVRRALE